MKLSDKVVVVTGGIDRSSTRTIKVVPAVPRVVAVAADRSTGVASIYATGLGGVTSDVRPGTAAPLDRLIRTGRDPMVRIGGVPVRVLFSGLAPGLVGVYQVNVEWPAQTPADAEVVVEAP